MNNVQFECPRCRETWESIDEFEEDAASLESMYENAGDIPIDDPPFDSLVALTRGTLTPIIEEVRAEKNRFTGSTMCVHCGECSLRMIANNRVAAHNTAAVAGAKRRDEEDISQI